MINLSGRQIEKVMKQLGIEAEEIQAEEVIIKGLDREIVIRNPKVTKIKAKGEESFQIIGKVEEKVSIKEEDVGLVASKAGISKEEAKKILEETKGDLAKAILMAKKN